MPKVRTADVWEPAIGSWVEEPRNERSGGRTGVVVAHEVGKSGHVKKVQVLTVNVMLLAGPRPKLKTYEQIWFSITKVRPFCLPPTKLEKLDEQFIQAIRPVEDTTEISDKDADKSITTNDTDDPVNKGENLTVEDAANDHGHDESRGEVPDEDVDDRARTSCASAPCVAAKESANEAATSLGTKTSGKKDANEVFEVALDLGHKQEPVVVGRKRPKSGIQSNIIVLEAPVASWQQRGRSPEADAHSTEVGSKVFNTPPKKRAKRAHDMLRCHVEVQWFVNATAHRIAAITGGRVSRQGLRLGAGGMIVTQGLVRDIQICKANIVKAHKSFMKEGRTTLVVKDEEDEASCHRVLYVFIYRASLDDLERLFCHLGED